MPLSRANATRRRISFCNWRTLPGRAARTDAAPPRGRYREGGDSVRGSTRRRSVWPGGNVFPNVAQGWHLDLDDAQAVEEILTERPSRISRSRSLLVATAPHVDGDSGAPAHAFDDPLLQDAQDLGLSAQAEVSDLVEEQSAAMRRLKEPDAFLNPVATPFSIPNSSASTTCPQRRAVQRHNGLRARRLV